MLSIRDLFRADCPSNDIEKISIASNGTVENFLGAISVADSGAADTMTQVTATGSANLDIDAAALDFAGNTTTSTATVDASAMTGRIKVDVDDGDANDAEEVASLAATWSDAIVDGDAVDAVGRRVDDATVLDDLAEIKAGRALLALGHWRTGTKGLWEICI